MNEKFNVKNNSEVGRYLVAGQNLRAGEEFLIETPFSYGPKIYSPLVCLGCHCELDSLTLCSNCFWPVCGESCSQQPIHKDNECKIFKEANIKYNPDGDPSCQLQCICPLRTMLESERAKDVWATSVSTMECHMENRKKQVDTWETEQVNVVRFLLDACKLSSRFSEELIQRICGILTVNCFEIVLRTSSRIRGLYFCGGLLSHNCVANTIHSLVGADNLRMVFRTTADVAEGAELFSSYTASIEPTMIRREKLLSTKYFSCECDRCKDPTELGTHLSSLKCTKCDNGIILSTNPLDSDAPWKCLLCDYGITGVGVQKIYSIIQDEITAFEMMEYNGEKLEALEKTLKKYKSILHPNHSWNVALWQLLIQMYGRVEGYTLNMLPDILLEHKAKMCKNFLDILNVIEPGITRIRGMTLYEYHVCLMLFNRSRYQYKELTLEKFKEEMRNVADVLQESASILGREPKFSTEGSVAMAARESLIRLQMSLDALSKNPPPDPPQTA